MKRIIFLLMISLAAVAVMAHGEADTTVDIDSDNFVTVFEMIDNMIIEEGDSILIVIDNDKIKEYGEKIEKDFAKLEQKLEKLNEEEIQVWMKEHKVEEKLQELGEYIDEITEKVKKIKITVESDEDKE